MYYQKTLIGEKGVRNIHKCIFLIPYSAFIIKKKNLMLKKNVMHFRL